MSADATDLEALKAEIASLGKTIEELLDSVGSAGGGGINKDAVLRAARSLVEAKKRYADNNNGIGVDGKPYTRCGQRKDIKRAEKAADRAIAKKKALPRQPVPRAAGRAVSQHRREREQHMIDAEKAAFAGYPALMRQYLQQQGMGGMGGMGAMGGMGGMGLMRAAGMGGMGGLGGAPGADQGGMGGQNGGAGNPMGAAGQMAQMGGAMGGAFGAMEGAMGMPGMGGAMGGGMPGAMGGAAARATRSLWDPVETERTVQNLLDLATGAKQARIDWDRSGDVLSTNKIMTWTPHLAVLLVGVADESSPLGLLKGQESTLLRHIYGYSLQFVYEDWKRMISPHYKQYVHNTIPAPLIATRKLIPTTMARHLQNNCDDPVSLIKTNFEVYTSAKGSSRCAFTRCGNVAFPPPSGIDVNMMPFIMGDKSSLPDNLQVYHDPLVAKCPVSQSELGKVCYLSITERYIHKGTTQRRGGLHIEAPIYQSNFTPGTRSLWGRGHMGRDKFVGGIYMASSVSNSCAIWDALVDQATTDSHGGMEHLRPLLNNPYYVPAGELIWMTDRTPHQAMPQKQSGYRQFFRLVTSDFNVWHSQHCTANPKVPLPPHVIVIHESRFDENMNTNNDNTHHDESENDERKPAARP